MYELKRLTTRNLEAALDKASTYRDLNQPEEADSICRDVLDVEPANQKALRILGLALTDRFTGNDRGLFEEALAVFGRLSDEYERVYYTGIAWEREGKAHMERDEAHSAVASLEKAIRLFERAEEIGPKDAADPILRYNRCVRLLEAKPSLKMALESPHADTPHFGD